MKKSCKWGWGLGALALVSVTRVMSQGHDFEEALLEKVGDVPLPHGTDRKMAVKYFAEAFAPGTKFDLFTRIAKAVYGVNGYLSREAFCKIYDKVEDVYNSHKEWKPTWDREKRIYAKGLAKLLGSPACDAGSGGAFQGVYVKRSGSGKIVSFDLSGGGEKKIGFSAQEPGKSRRDYELALDAVKVVNQGSVQSKPGISMYLEMGTAYGIKMAKSTQQKAGTVWGTGIPLSNWKEVQKEQPAVAGFVNDFVKNPGNYEALVSRPVKGEGKLRVRDGAVFYADVEEAVIVTAKDEKSVPFGVSIARVKAPMVSEAYRLE